MITFHNPGELDPRLITTFGVSIKEGHNPIGFFGTGLKYAIATLLRTGHKMVIWSGEECYTFHTAAETIRGKEIQRIYMAGGPDHTTALPFALDLGRNWEPWMAYRELRCNAIDEGGTVESSWTSAMSPQPTPGTTAICVTGAPIEEVHRLQHKYFITGHPILVTDECEVYARSGRDIFYRGVRVGQHAEHPGLYTYNILAPVKLTEDRTIDPTDGQNTVANAIGAVWYAETNEARLAEILCAKPGSTMEGNINFYYWNMPYAGRAELPFVRVAKRLAGSKMASLNPYARKAAEAVLPAEKLHPTPAALSPVERAMIGKAKSFLVRHYGLPMDTPIHVADNLGDGVLGIAHGGEIWVARLALSQGTKMTAGTIYEEWVHLTYSHADCTRGMQNFLLDRLMSLGEVIQGEPL